MKIYVVIDEASKNDKVQGIMGVWTNWKDARQQANTLRQYRMENNIHIITYKKFGQTGFWYENKFTEPNPYTK